MVTNIHKHTQARVTAKAFLFGLVLGIILQGIGTPVDPRYDARLSSSFMQSTKQSMIPTEKKRTTLSERVHRRMLLSSAQRLGMRMFVVAHNEPLRRAAPEDPSTSAVFPAFSHTVFPVTRAPNWGAMHSPEVWDRSYTILRDNDFVPVPPYDISTLTIPLSSLTQTASRETESIITAKLFYSTRYFSAYDIDAEEFSGMHSGIDLKLAPGTPIGAIAGGLVRYAQDEGALGLHVIIEHRLENGEKYFSIYGHFDSVTVQAGEAVTPGKIIGTVGTTGNTTGPHLHLQVDRDRGMADHIPYQPRVQPMATDVSLWSVNPVTFIQEHSMDNQ